MNFIPARYYTSGRTAKIRLIVIHDMEWGEYSNTAENCAHWFQDSRAGGSAHYCIDNNSIVQCVRDHDTAWGAPYVNAFSLHLEHAGYASQTRRQWLDAYSTAMLKLSARLSANLCYAYGINPVHLSNADLRNGKSGIVGHVQCTQVFGPKGGHTDPGTNFPYDAYITLVRREYDLLRQGPKPKPKQEAEMVVYISPVGNEPGDGIYAVTEQGVYPVTANRWGILVALGGAVAHDISRDRYNALLSEVKEGKL